MDLASLLAGTGVVIGIIAGVVQVLDYLQKQRKPRKDKPIGPTSDATPPPYVHDSFDHPSGPSTVGVLPQEVSETFKDRVAEISRVRELLAQPSVKLISIVGRGGIGKTALLSKLCLEVERGELFLSGAATSTSANGILYISCRGSDMPMVGRLFDGVGQILGDPHDHELADCWRDVSRSLSDKCRVLLSKLRAGYCLLVLDNIEDVLAPDNTIADDDLRTFVEISLQTPSALRLLVTSREQIVVGGAALKAVRTVALEKGLPEAEAMALLRDLDPDGRLGLREASDDLLRGAARRCYGIPRALEAVAGILSSDPTRTLEQLLGQTALFDEQVVENLIAEQYQRVSDDQRRVLEALAVYDRPVSAGAIRYLLGHFFKGLDTDDCLPALVRNYFVTYRRDRETFELHPLDRQHAYAHIPDAGEGFTRRTCHRRAAEFYETQRRPESEWKSVTDLQPQLDQFDQLVYAGDYDEACHLLNAIDFHHLAVWGHSDLIIALRTRLVGHLTDLDAQYVNWDLLGCAYNRLWLAEDAARCFRQALELAEAEGDDRAPMDLRGNLGRSLMLVGQVEEATVLFRQTAETMRGFGAGLGEGLWAGRLGEALQRLDRTREALDRYQFALDVSRRCGDDHWRVTHLSNIGDVYRHLGEPETATRYLEEGLQRALSTESRQGEAFCHMRIGQVCHEGGRLEQARAAYESALRIGLPPSNFICAIRLGLLCLERDDAEGAKDYFERGSTLCHVLLEKTPRLYDALYQLGLAQLSSGQTDAALATYRRALDVCSARGVVRSGLRDLGLLKRVPHAPAGLDEVTGLLDEVLRGEPN